MKRFLVLFALLLVSGGVMAQKKTNFGIKGGLNVSSAISKCEDERGVEDALCAYNFGVFMEHRNVNNILGVQLELLYSKVGIADKIEGVDANISAGTICLPVLLKIQATKCFSIELGPQFSYFFNPKLELKDDSNSAKTDLPSEMYNKVEVAASVGMSLNFSERVGIYARYNIGLTDMFVVEFEGIEATTKSRVFQAGLYYRF